MTLPDLLVEMRAEFEKQFSVDMFTPRQIHGILSFIETQMKRVSEETYKAVKLDKDNGIHHKTGMPVYMDFNKGLVAAWNEAKDSIDEAYKTFTHQP